MRKLFFDIETEVNPPAVELLDDPKPPSNYKDPEKIAAYVEEQKQERIKTAPLDPDLGKITAIAFRLQLTDKTTAFLLGDPDTPTETDLIKMFWQQFSIARGYTCGYNILGFDLPYLLRRSMDLGITIPFFPNLVKFRTEPTTDLMAILYNWGQAKGLKWVCKRYGIPNPLPDLNGAHYAAMDPDTRRAYVANDVAMVCGLYAKMCSIYLPADPLVKEYYAGLYAPSPVTPSPSLVIPSPIQGGAGGGLNPEIDYDEDEDDEIPF